MLIERDRADEGDLFSWWDGSELDDDAQFSCAMNEQILVLDADDESLLAKLGPGRHALPPQLVGREGPVLIIFVTTSPITLAPEGVLDEAPAQPWVELRAQLTVRDAEQALELLPHIDDDELPESFLETEILNAVLSAVLAQGGDLEDLQAKRASLQKLASELLNEELEVYGLAAQLDGLELSEAGAA